MNAIKEMLSCTTTEYELINKTMMWLPTGRPGQVVIDNVALPLAKHNKIIVGMPKSFINEIEYRVTKSGESRVVVTRYAYVLNGKTTVVSNQLCNVKHFKGSRKTTDTKHARSLTATNFTHLLELVLDLDNDAVDENGCFINLRKTTLNIYKH